ncbi:MAG TPA: hypothetical protein VJ603_09365, partial [Paucimonas sp.]|nr:hypothetical protein [Paucimonas sp.]HJW57570.1 hypothetical protein [Burkholderiaceae bacterium]
EQAGQLAQVVSVFQLEGATAGMARPGLQAVADRTGRKAVTPVAMARTTAAPVRRIAPAASAPAGDDWEEF